MTLTDGRTDVRTHGGTDRLYHNIPAFSLKGAGIIKHAWLFTILIKKKKKKKKKKLVVLLLWPDYITCFAEQNIHINRRKKYNLGYFYSPDCLTYFP